MNFTMSKKILIDLLQLRELETCNPEAIDIQLLQGGAFKTIREIATFRFTCRKCEDAPCISACPAEALEKDENGIISRAVNLCIRCKSCVCICPFGTIMNDLFEVKTSGYNYFDLSNEEELTRFAKSFPDNIVSIVETDEDQEKNIFKLTDNVLVREFAWEV
jgi:Fe-S-cluster-containing hydrogenase component 2